MRAAVTLRPRQRPDETHRGDLRDQPVAVRGLLVADLVQRQRPERGRGGDSAAALLVAVGPGRMLGPHALQHVAELELPRWRLVLVVLHVPEQRQPAPGADHAGELGDRRRPVEPVERVRADDRVDGGARERQCLRRPGERLDARGGRAQALPQPRQRLDRDHVEAARDERARELAGARADVGDPCARHQPEPARGGGDGLRRVTRAAVLVVVGDLREAGHERVQGHAREGKSSPCGVDA